MTTISVRCLSRLMSTFALCDAWSSNYRETGSCNRREKKTSSITCFRMQKSHILTKSGDCSDWSTIFSTTASTYILLMATCRAWRSCMNCVRVQSWSEEACSFEVCCSNTTGHWQKLYILSNNLEGMHPHKYQTSSGWLVVWCRFDIFQPWLCHRFRLQPKQIQGESPAGIFTIWYR